VSSIDNLGLNARWRGSALSWHLLDAVISPLDSRVICALHRGDSFIKLDKETIDTRVAAYKWNGFGFTGITDSGICESGLKLLGK
jgi:hypothetical protein